MSLLSQSIALARQGARWRTELYPVKVTLGPDVIHRAAAKSPTKLTRMLNDHGTGYVVRGVATFLTGRDWSARPALGSRFTIRENPLNSAEVGTVWQVFELTPGTSGEEDRSVCFRLD